MTLLPGQQGPSHTNSITALAFSDDSKLLVTASYDWTVRIWDVESKTQRTVIPLPTYTYVIDIAFLPDNRRLVFATSWQLYFWSEESGLTQKFPDDVEQCFFPSLPDKCLASRNSDSLYLLQIEGETVSEKALGNFPKLDWATTSNNGRILAIHSNDKLTLIDLESASVLWTIDAIQTEPEFSISFSSNDLQLAIATGFSKPCIVDVATGEVVVTFGGEKSPHVGDGKWYQTLALFFLDNQYLATAGTDGLIRFWNARTGEVVGCLTDTNTFTTALDPETATHEQRLAAHDGWIRAIALSPDQRLLASAGDDHVIKLWSTESRTLIGTLGRRTNELVGVEFTHDGQQIVAGYKDGSIRLWSITENRLINARQAHDGPLTAMAITRRGVATSSGFDVIKIWDLSDFKLLSVIDNPGTYFINELAAAHDDNTLAFACWSKIDSRRVGHVIIWDLVAERPLSIPNDWDDVPIVKCGWWWSINAMAISPDGTVLATSIRHKIQIWDARSGRRLTQLWEGDGTEVEHFTTLAFSRDGKQFAAGTYGVYVSLWNTADWTPAERLRSPADSISNLTFSADGKSLAVATHYVENVDIHDLTSHELTSLLGHTNSVQSVAYSPDGSLLATGGRDGIVVVWKNGEMLTSFAIE